MLASCPEFTSLSGKFHSLAYRVDGIEDKVSGLNDSVRDVVRGQEANFTEVKSLLGARGSQSSTPDGTPRLPIKQTQEPPKLVSALDHTRVDSDSNASVSPKKYETLVITKAQHQNFVEPMQIQSTSTLTKVWQEGKKWSSLNAGIRCSALRKF